MGFGLVASFEADPLERQANAARVSLALKVLRFIMRFSASAKTSLIVCLRSSLVAAPAMQLWEWGFQ